MILDSTVFVQTLSPTATNNDLETYIDHPCFLDPSGQPTNAVKVNIQAADSQLVMLSEGVLGKTYRIFTTISGLVEGMKLTVSGTGENYYVRGRERYQIPLGAHYELLATTRDDRK